MDSYIKNICRLSADSGPLPNSTNKSINIKQLYQQIQYHQISALTYHYKDQLQSIYPQVDSDFYELCQKDQIKNVRREMVFENQILQLAEISEKYNLDFFLIKGLSLSTKLYSPSYLRTYNDIDILIDKTDFHTWRNILVKKDFKEEQNLYSSFTEEKIKKYDFSLHYTKNGSNLIALDLHLGLSNYLHPFSFPKGEYLKDPDFYKDTIPTLNKEHLVPYLLFHIFKHNYFKIIWWIDLYLLVDNFEIDFKKVETLLQKNNSKKLWSLFLDISKDLFGRKPRLTARYRIKGSNSNYINTDLIIQGSPPHAQKINRMILPLYYLDGPEQIFNFLFKQLFPPIDLVLSKENSTNFFINYIIYLGLRIKKFIKLFF